MSTPRVDTKNHNGEYTTLVVWFDAIIADDGVEASPEIELNVHYRPGHEAEAKGLLIDAFYEAYNRIGSV